MEQFNQAPVALDTPNKISSNSEAISKLQDEIGKVVDGNSCSGFTLNKGDYVIVKNSTITGITDGLYTYSSSTSKSAGSAVSAGELTAVSGGGLNELNSNIDTKLGLFGIYTDNGKTASNSPSDYNAGITFTVTGSSTTFPLGYGLVITIKNSDSRVVQHSYNYTGAFRLRVSSSETNWSEWKTIA